MTPTSMPRYRAALLFLVACALLATACGSSATVLEGDTASAPANAPVSTQEPAASAATSEPAAAEPAPESAATDRADEDQQAEGDEADGSQIVLAADPTPEPEAASPAVLTNTVGSGGAVGTIEDVKVIVGETVATNADVDSLIAGQPELDDRDGNLLLLTVAFEGLIEQDWSLSDDDLRLEDTNGRPYVVEGMYDATGDDVFAIDIDGRTYREMRLAIPTDSLIQETTGWNLLVGDPDNLPLVLPVSGSAYDDPYPLALSTGQEASFDTGSFAGCDGATFTTKIDDVQIALENADRFKDNGNVRDADRVPANERLVTIDMTTTGTSEHGGGASGLNCGKSVLWPDFILFADGKPTATAIAEVPDVEGFASVTTVLVFQIPAGTQEIELVGGAEQQSLGNWQFTLPAALGEQGAELVPFGADLAEIAGPLGDRPTDLTSIELGSGGASGQILRVDMAVAASSSTNADIDSFITGNPELDGDGRTWMVVEFSAESTVDETWQFGKESLVLVDPSGRPHSATELFDRTGEDVLLLQLRGIEFLDLRAAFETDGLITDATGWTLEIGMGDAIPLALPLSGDAVNEWPVPLTSGQTETLTYEPWLCRDGGILDAEIAQARIDIEGYNYNWAQRDLRRVDSDHRYIVIDLNVFNPKENTGADVCGQLLQWPEFTLNVDGRLTSAFSYDQPTVDPFTTETVFLNYRVPKDAQIVTLIGGDNQEIVSWQIKDNQEVLSDFGAEARNERTVITLDETLLFAFGESTLQQAAFAPLSRVANVVNESSGNIDVVGHTDAIGDEASNQALSLARAEAVAAALVDAGVDEARLNITGEGESSPVAPNENDDGSDNPAGRAENRRVEISFDSD